MILFLDIDGVLHPDPPQPDQRLRSLPRLVEILRDYPQIEVVISSLWREHLSLDQLRDLFPADLRERIIDVTPIAERIDGWLPARREGEILDWLEASGRADEPWLAIDDQAWQFTQHRDRLVECWDLGSNGTKTQRRPAANVQLKYRSCGQHLLLSTRISHPDAMHLRNHGVSRLRAWRSAHFTPACRPRQTLRNPRQPCVMAVYIHCHSRSARPALAAGPGWCSFSQAPAEPAKGRPPEATTITIARRAACVYFAIPRNTAKQRSTSTKAFASMRPKAGPSLSRFTVTALSTITCDGFFRPFSALGWTVMRSNGAPTRVLVMGSTVTLVCSLNWLA